MSDREIKIYSYTREEYEALQAALTAAAERETTLREAWRKLGDYLEYRKDHSAIARNALAEMRRLSPPRAEP